LWMDENKIEQVFLNVFMNSIQAMPDGGTLTVRTFTKKLQASEVGRNPGDRKGDGLKAGDVMVVAQVDDTGLGIDKDRLSKVFDPFFTTKPTGKGTGLGLTVARKIVEIHGGTITIGNLPAGGVRVTMMFKG